MVVFLAPVLSTSTSLQWSTYLAMLKDGLLARFGCSSGRHSRRLVFKWPTCKTMYRGGEGTIYGRDYPLLAFIHPGFDSGPPVAGSLFQTKTGRNF